MTQPSKSQGKDASRPKAEDSFDFAETSDMCDFGYALVSTDIAPPRQDQSDS